VSFKLTNVGQGPAIFTTVELSNLVLPYKMNRAGEAITLRVGEEVELELTTDDAEDEELGFALARPEPDEHGRFPLVTLTARCQDVRGEFWENDALLVWDSPNKVVRFGNATFSYPP
jgi:hypothetical protein